MTSQTSQAVSSPALSVSGLTPGMCVSLQSNREMHHARPAQGLTGGDAGDYTCQINNSCDTPVTSNAAGLTVTGTPGQPGAISGETAVCSGSTRIYSVPAVTHATGYNWTLPTGASISQEGEALKDWISRISTREYEHGTGCQ